MKIARQESPHFQPTLLLVGTRLGIDHVTPVYWDALKDALCMPQSVGIAGYVLFIDAVSDSAEIAPLKLINC